METNLFWYFRLETTKKFSLVEYDFSQLYTKNQIIFFLFVQIKEFLQIPGVTEFQMVKSGILFYRVNLESIFRVF